MARPKAFDPDDVLDKAVQEFWAKGYDGTSMQELVERMGIHRGSIYATFGSKQELFLAALERYGDVIVSQLLSVLEAQPSGKESIRRFFATVVEHIVTAGPLRGCLLTNSAVERGLSDPRTRTTVCRLLQRIEDGFYRTLSQTAVPCRGVDNTDDAKATARFLTSSLQGLLVIGKLRPERPLLETINQVTLSVLDREHPQSPGEEGKIC